MSETLGDGDPPIDVCISHPDGPGRVKLHFRSEQPLVETLIAWTQRGQADIWLTWGGTPPVARDRIERTLAAAPVRYTTPPAASAPPTRAGLLLTALGAAAAIAGGIYLMAQRLNDAGQQLDALAEEERQRDEQQQRALARTLDAAKARAFRELDDADPAVRLQAVATVGQVYAADPQAVPALVERVTDDDPRVRVAAVVVLGNARSKSVGVAQALRSRLADEDATVRRAAREALAKIEAAEPQPE